MSALSRTLSSRQAWGLLKGLVVLYKPSEYPVGSLTRKLENNILAELNQLHKQELGVRMKGNGIIDYSLHPLVQGDSFRRHDVRVEVVNPMDLKTSGLLLCTINNTELNENLQKAKLLRTYRVSAELGKATRSGYTDGRVVELSRNPYLKRSMVDKALASVQGSHQREAFKYAGVSLKSQAAYELAVKGPVRPEDASDALIYRIACVGLQPPKLDLEFTCINETTDFVVQLMAEIGWRLKTNAAVETLRCIRYGFFTLDHALLDKHLTLRNVLTSLLNMEKLIRENNALVAEKKHFFTPETEPTVLSDEIDSLDAVVHSNESDELEEWEK